MGDETKDTLIDQGNRDPLHATRKPSTARKVEERPAQAAEMPAGTGDGKDEESRDTRRR